MKLGIRGGVIVSMVGLFWEICMTFVMASPAALSNSLDLSPMVRPQSGKYVTRHGSDFVYDGKPIRFWGVNIGSGDLASHEAVENFVRRARNMGCNAVRLWATGRPFYTAESAAQQRMPDTRKGDGSKLDLYDYFVYRLQEEGIFVHNTALGYVTQEQLENWPTLGVKLEKTTEHYDHAYYNVFPIMGYLDPTFAEMREAHIRLYLNRVNPYTGQKYGEMPLFATWELANENHTVASILEGRFDEWPPVFREALQQRWNEWLQAKYGDRAGVLAAWGALGDEEDPAAGTVQPAPSYKQAADYPEQRGRDFVRCVEERFIEVSQRLAEVARSCSRPGVGIAVAPILANTHADLNLHAQYASSCLDFASSGVYQTPFTTDRRKPHYPWRPICTERPHFYNLNFQTVEDKPFLVYEHSFFRPYPYRAEWNPAMMLMGAGLGWDAIYMYIFGQPWAVCDPVASDLGFTSKPLPNPPSTDHDGYCVGFHHGNDEILMASLAVTGQAFINGIEPNREKTRVTFGQPAIEGPGYKNYSPSGPAAPLPEREMAGGESEWYNMPNIYRKFMHTSVRKRLTLAFDPKQDAPIRVHGDLVDMTELGDEDQETLRPSDQVVWDAEKQRIVLDSPHSKIVVGFIKDGYRFADGVELGPISSEFAFFGISSRDGLPVHRSRDLLVTLVSTSANTDYEFDPGKIHGSVLGHINGIVNRGQTPVVVDRVAGTVRLPGVRGRLECYNFAGYRYRDEDLDGAVTFDDHEPLFLARIRRQNCKELSHE